MFRHSSKFRSPFRVHIKLPACSYSDFTTSSVFRGTLAEEELDRKMGDSWHWERQKLGAKKLSSFLRSGSGFTSFYWLESFHPFLDAQETVLSLFLSFSDSRKLLKEKPLDPWMRRIEAFKMSLRPKAMNCRLCGSHVVPSYEVGVV